VIPELLDRGVEVAALARSAEAAVRMQQLGAIPIYGDLNEPDSVDEAFQAAEADTLVNLASLGFGHAPIVVAAAEEAAVRRCVFISTTAIFTALPAESRAVRTVAEETIRDSALDWTIIRPTMIYGRPGDRNMERLLRLLMWAPLIPVPGGGERLLQPVYVDDLAWFVAEVARQEKAIGKEYDVPGPEPLSLRELIRLAGSSVGRTPSLLAVPLTPAVAGLRLYERVAKRPRLRPEQLLRLNEDKAFAFSAAAELGYRPRPFADGIAEEARLLRVSA